MSSNRLRVFDRAAGGDCGESVEVGGEVGGTKEGDGGEMGWWAALVEANMKKLRCDVRN